MFIVFINDEPKYCAFPCLLVFLCIQLLMALQVLPVMHWLNLDFGARVSFL